MMRLADLLPDVPRYDIEIGGLADRAGEVQPGDAFLALAGSRRHGLTFAPEAERRGAAVVLYEPGAVEVPALTIPTVAVRGLGERVAELAARFYGHPSRELEVIGITGTNGKTSCSFYLAQALGGAVVGTLGWGRWPDLKPTDHTTAPAVATQRRLAALRDAGIATVAMEVSSHALDQGRVDQVAFDIALWTNLTRDHLDYHRTLAAYRDAKRKLFAFPGLEIAVINLDDPVWIDFYRGTGAQVWGYAWHNREPAPFPVLRAEAVRFLPDGIQFTACLGRERAPVRVALLGEGNLANVLAVLTVLRARGLDLAEAARRLARLRAVPGRMECFSASGSPRVVVDYAHTPAALEMALRSLRRHCRGKLWLVFGCGGERDRGKRPQMGRIAERWADRVIVTDDNPRGEDGDAIVREIAAGMCRPPRVLRDRATAIATAFRSAAAEDVVLVAGKGHETWQEVQGRRRPFSDRDVIANLMELEITSCV